MDQRPSRSKMLQHQPKLCTPHPITDGDVKVKVCFERGTTSFLSIRTTEVTAEYLEYFCKEHNLTMTEKNGYFNLS